MTGRKKREREEKGERKMEGKRRERKEREMERWRGGRERKEKGGKGCLPLPGRKLWFAEVHDREIPRGPLQSNSLTLPNITYS